MVQDEELTIRDLNECVERLSKWDSDPEIFAIIERMQQKIEDLAISAESQNYTDAA